jgi:hypothetical protein
MDNAKAPLHLIYVKPSTKMPLDMVLSQVFMNTPESVYVEMSACIPSTTNKIFIF